MDIRLLGDEVKTATKTRYAVIVGGRPGTVTFTQLRVLRAFDANGVADLSAILDAASYRSHIYRLRRELQRINPAFDPDSIVSIPLHMARDQDYSGMYYTSLIISDN